MRVKCPFVAPPLVDLAWRLFLTYTPHYEHLAKIMGVFVQRDHERQRTDFKRYQQTVKSYRAFYRNSRKLDFAIWVLYKDEAAFTDAWKHTYFIAKERQQQLIAEAKKITESSSKIEEELINLDKEIEAANQAIRADKAAVMKQSAELGNLPDSDLSVAQWLFEEHALHK